MLTVEDLRVRYGRVEALRGVSLRLDEGELVAVVGPNGAGKSTLLNTIAGRTRPQSGDVVFRGRSLNGLKRRADRRVGRGPRSPEGRQCSRRSASRRTSARPDGEPRADLAGRRSSSSSSAVSRSWSVTCARRPAVSRAASSSSSRSPARWRRSRRCCCSTSRRSGSRRCWSTRSSSWSSSCVPRARRSCWSSRTRDAPCSSPTARYVLRSGRIVLAGERDDLLAEFEQMTTAYLGG